MNLFPVEGKMRKLAKMAEISLMDSNLDNWYFFANRFLQGGKGWPEKVK